MQKKLNEMIDDINKAIPSINGNFTTPMLHNIHKIMLKDGVHLTKSTLLDMRTVLRTVTEENKSK